ncbi:prephenate dehydrogenase/arogenate dehydrogenase family protein [Glaciimonas soli]|uniref:prephenate dehydrogenase n=1 Tax=Glaciimonas soli TaxID=2590999 RepID=A0A843YX22_9BURK|nr:prephenate dehydrogenase/arogenate dehydrogenase family protein [Glaciimonas soli]MQR02547.1 prephenate dehydrogenase/arogenate dehydrogenase family protein [Glaciimonas soli]
MKKIVIFGVGLIGGSFALALKAANKNPKTGLQIVGVGRSQASLQRALALGIIDTIAASVEEAMADADLVLIAAPVAQTAAILTSICPYLQAGTIVTDAGSTKSDVEAAARAVLGNKIAQFVPGHPIAGRESNGPDAAIVDLYIGKKVVLTPLPENTAEDVAKVAAAWRLCGAIIHQLSPQQHDEIFAAVSHFPHMLAYALVDQIANKSQADVMFQYAASGFRDFTRIAGSSPEMWRDISLANRHALLGELSVYQAQLMRLRHLLEAGDGAGLEAIYSNAQQARHDWITAIESAEKQNKEGGN